MCLLIIRMFMGKVEVNLLNPTYLLSEQRKANIKVCNERPTHSQSKASSCASALSWCSKSSVWKLAIFQSEREKENINHQESLIFDRNYYF